MSDPTDKARAAIQALSDLLANRIERASVPGVWRVYRNEDGSAVLEVFSARNDAPAAPSR